MLSVIFTLMFEKYKRVLGFCENWLVLLGFYLVSLELFSSVANQVHT